jgi:hypothetical protein
MAITPGGSLNSVPAPNKQTLNTNYLDFTGTNDTTWAQQYLPDLMEKEAEVFGPRTISGFLAQVGAEEAMTSDQVVWSEQGRLHLSYTGQVTAATAGVPTNASEITINKEIDGAAVTSSGSVVDHAIRIHDTVIVANSNGVFKCMVTEVLGNVISVACYTQDSLAATSGANDTTILVYGSEYAKGKSYTNAAGTAVSDTHTANEPKFKSFSNKPIIIKDYYEVSGSDASRIGWVEVSSEMGQSGYLWYLKAEADTRARFNDYLEMAMIEGEISAADGSNTLVEGAFGMYGETGNQVGTQGLFAAVEERGNLTSGVTGVNAATDLAEFDAILAEFDKQGAIEEYMMFVNRSTSLAIDDMLASMNSYGAGGTSYGVFDNDEDMALNLGFSGFRRGSYDFYKSDFRYLNDKATRGGINDAAGANAIRGIMIPAGVSTVYDQQMGKNMKRPFLHVRYRASATDDRRMKTWTTGSVGAATSSLDAMQLHFLSERCLITQGANNFMLMK